MNVYLQFFGKADNVEINGIHFLALLVLRDTYNIIVNLIPLEKIQDIIKACSVVLCTLLLVSLYVACVAYMQLFVAEWVYDGLLDWRSNFVSSRNITRVIPQDKIIDISDHDVFGTQTIYVAGSRVIHNETHLFYKDFKNLHPVKYSIKKYIGEGARLECEFTVSGERLLQFYSIHPFVSKDRLDIQNSYRHTIHTLNINGSESLLYNIALDIYALENEDFGTYKAGVRISQSAYNLVSVIELYACVFSVSLIDDYYVYKDVPVGGMLRFRDLFLTLVSNNNHVRVEHMVNGVNLNLIPGISPDCCLNYIQYATFNFSDMKLLTDVNISNHKVEIFEVVADICLCPSLYGIHRIKFYHDLYDPTENKWITVEFLHPQITVVYPTSPVLPWKNISEQERFPVESSKNEKDFSLFNGTLFFYLQSAKDLEFFLKNLIENSLLIGIVFILLIVTYWSLLLLLCVIEIIIWGIVKIEIPFQRELGHQGPQTHEINTENPVLTSDAEKNTYVYDAFVSNVEEDRHFVMHILQPILLQYRVRVLFGEEDLPSGPRIDNLQVALNQSKFVLIVVSEEYLTDKFYSFFFSKIVLPLLDEDSLSCSKIVLIKYKPCKIPVTWVAHDKIVVVNYTD